MNDNEQEWEKSLKTSTKRTSANNNRHATPYPVFGTAFLLFAPYHIERAHLTPLDIDEAKKKEAIRINWFHVPEMDRFDNVRPIYFPCEAAREGNR